MSTAERGHSLIEMTATLAMVVLIASVVERTISSTQDVERLLSATRLVTERGQRTAFDLRDLVGASRRLFGDDDVGRAYLGALDRSATPPLAGARLPVFDEVHPLGPDEPGDPCTGNVLFLVREGEAVRAVASAATKKFRRIDTYCFVCAYPSLSARTLVTAAGAAHDLVLWRSVSYPSYPQIIGITNTAERAQVVRDLVSRLGFDRAWDGSAALGAAFYDLHADGTIDAVPASAPEIPEDAETSARGRLVFAGLQLARTDGTDVARTPVLAVDDPATWSPAGFEVKVAGASGSRKVWIHLVVEAPAGLATAVQGNTVVASATDM